MKNMRTATLFLPRGCPLALMQFVTFTTTLQDIPKFSGKIDVSIQTNSFLFLSANIKTEQQFWESHSIP